MIVSQRDSNGVAELDSATIRCTVPVGSERKIESAATPVGCREALVGLTESERLLLLSLGR